MDPVIFALIQRRLEQTARDLQINVQILWEMRVRDRDISTERDDIVDRTHDLEVEVRRLLGEVEGLKAERSMADRAYAVLEEMFFELAERSGETEKARENERKRGRGEDEDGDEDDVSVMDGDGDGEGEEEEEVGGDEEGEEEGTEEELAIGNSSSEDRRHYRLGDSGRKRRRIN